MASELISVEEAGAMSIAHAEILAPVIVPLMEAGGLVLAEDVLAVSDVPPFNQSSMDGYAFRFEDWKHCGKLRISGEMPAGSSENLTLKAGTAVRIFTGAAVPDGADTIVMQEKVTVTGDSLFINDQNILQGANFRTKGTEARSGTLALAKGTLMTPAALGYLAGVGVHEINTYPRPSVCVILTGNELQTPGESLAHGQVYESSSYSLNAALLQEGITKINFFSCEDNLEKLTNILAGVLENYDLVLITGGVSVGEYDFVIPAASACGVQQIFHKVRQKPGKPLFYGKMGRKVVFGLPGNPGSVLNCFYEYVLPVLGKMSCREKKLISRIVPLQTAVRKPPGLTQFLKGFYDGATAVDLQAHDSFRLSSFAQANCLICLEEEKTEFLPGELVEIHLLPHYYG